MKKWKAPCLVVILGLGIPLCLLLCCCLSTVAIIKETNVKGQLCEQLEPFLKVWDPFSICVK